MLQRIKADVRQHAGAGVTEVVAAGLGGIVEEGPVLEVVDVDVAGLQRDVGCRPVAELDHLDVQALRLRFVERGIDAVGINAGEHADLDRLGRRRAARSRPCDEQERPEGGEREPSNGIEHEQTAHVSLLPAISL